VNRVADRGAPRDSTHLIKAVLLVAVVVVLAVVILDRLGTTRSGTPVSSPGPTTTTTITPVTTTLPPTATALPPAQVRVQVLNGVNSAAPLAAQESEKLAASKGYPTAAPNDTTSNVTASRIYIVTKGFYPEAVALAETVGLPVTDIRRHVPTTAPIPLGAESKVDLILVIGPDLASRV
jgi:hypothetical protein